MFVLLKLTALRFTVFPWSCWIFSFYLGLSPKLENLRSAVYGKVMGISSPFKNLSWIHLKYLNVFLSLCFKPKQCVAMVWCLGTDEAHTAQTKTVLRHYDIRGHWLPPKFKWEGSAVTSFWMNRKLNLTEDGKHSCREMTRCGPMRFPGSKVVEGSYTWEDAAVVTQMAVSALFRLPLYISFSCGKQNETLGILDAWAHVSMNN